MSKYAAAYGNPQGPGDARPTALQIVENENLQSTRKLAGKTVFITGANQGIGFETARALHATGATVYLGVRDRAKGEQAIESIRGSDPSNDAAPMHAIEISLDSLDSVRKAATKLLTQAGEFNILILNAGVMATPKGKTIDGLETQFATNHVGHFLLFQQLKPALLAAATPSFHSRVIIVTSAAHRSSEVRFHDFDFDEPGSYIPWVSYGQSKTANIYMSNEIEKRYGSKGLHSISIHPGIIRTNLEQYLDQDALGSMSANTELQQEYRSVAQGAATSVYAAVSAEWEGKGGRYLADCVEAGALSPDCAPMSLEAGYAPWAYDEDKATRLWAESNKIVGLEADD